MTASLIAASTVSKAAEMSLHTSSMDSSLILIIMEETTTMPPVAAVIFGSYNHLQRRRSLQHMYMGLRVGPNSFVTGANGSTMTSAIYEDLVRATQVPFNMPSPILDNSCQRKIRPRFPFLLVNKAQKL